MSRNKKPKIHLEIESEDWKALGISRKRGGAGPHKDKRTKRRRTRSDDTRKSIEDSRKDCE